MSRRVFYIAPTSHYVGHDIKFIRNTILRIPAFFCGLDGFLQNISAPGHTKFRCSKHSPLPFYYYLYVHHRADFSFSKEIFGAGNIYSRHRNQDSGLLSWGRCSLTGRTCIITDIPTGLSVHRFIACPRSALRGPQCHRHALAQAPTGSYSDVLADPSICKFLFCRTSILHYKVIFQLDALQCTFFSLTAPTFRFSGLKACFENHFASTVEVYRSTKVRYGTIPQVGFVAPTLGRSNATRSGQHRKLGVKNYTSQLSYIKVEFGY